MHALHRSMLRLLVIVGASTLRAACVAPYDDELSETTVFSESTLPGQVGGVSSAVTSVEADVIGIDYKKRTVVLQDAQANRRTLAVDKDAPNFDAVKVGDHVLLQIASEMAVFLISDLGQAITADHSVDLQAPVGEKPSFLIANTTQINAVIAAVDLATHKATLQFEDGSQKIIDVRPDVELGEQMVGKALAIRVTEAMALSVTAR